VHDVYFHAIVRKDEHWFLYLIYIMLFFFPIVNACSNFFGRHAKPLDGVFL
jgi:hypothetical protein